MIVFILVKLKNVVLNTECKKSSIVLIVLIKKFNIKLNI